MRFFGRYCIPMFVAACGLQACKAEDAPSFIISDGRIYVGEIEVPLGRVDDDRYDKVLGKHSHKGSDGALYWQRKGVEVVRREGTANCTVIVRLHLQSGYEAYIENSKEIIALQGVNGPILIENVPVALESDLSPLEERTSEKKISTPFGYAFNTHHDAPRQVLIFTSHDGNKNINKFVRVMSNDFDRECE